jgi:uncharacterized protein YlxP (DUF503 family)
MIVGAAAVEIQVHGSQSLKAKRGVVRSISQRVRNRFNVSVAEVGGQGTWQRAVLGISAAGAEAPVVRRVLERAAEFIEDMHLAEVLAVDFEIVALPYEEGGWEDAAEDEEEEDDEVNA